jgi:hypothetical protein
LDTRDTLQIARSLIEANPEMRQRWVRVGRTGYALAALGVLVLPAAVAHAPRPESVSDAGTCPVPTEEVTADVGSPDGGMARGGKLPERFPDEWMRAPCPKGANMRTVRGRCFVATGQQPPCSIGHEHARECLLALTGAKPTPNTLER